MPTLPALPRHRPPFAFANHRSSVETYTSGSGSTSDVAAGVKSKDHAHIIGPMAQNKAPGVQIIGRPDEAFTRIPVRVKRAKVEEKRGILGWKGKSKKMDTIATWGFDRSYNMTLDA